MSSGWHRKANTEAEHARRQKYNGPAHREAGKRLALLVASGNAHCWRCGKWFRPDTPRAYRGRDGWVVGHDDVQVDLIRGAECYPCNKSAADRKGNRVSNAARKPFQRTSKPRAPRSWERQ